MKRRLHELREWLRLFAALIRDVLNPDTWAAILDDFTSGLRHSTGQLPDPRVEARRARRAQR